MPSAAPELSLYRESFAAGIAPDPRLTVEEWAEEHRYLSTRTSSEPGRWRTARTPYLAEIMRSVSATDPIETVVVMGSAQVGKTEVGLNLLGFTIDMAPGPVMGVWPTVDLAKRYCRQRIDPLIEDCPRLREKVAESRARTPGNTTTMKEFPGGLLVLTGANSSVGLRSMPVKTLLMDDIDAFPPDVDQEGDPVALAEARTRTFARRKIYKASTPKISGLSRVEAAFLISDQRRFHVPCPACSLMQVLRWANFRWDEGKPETVRYVCEGCGVLIPESAKPGMLEGGRWIAGAKARDPRVRGYHLTALLAPLGWYTWEAAARDFLKAKDNPELLRVFVNTVLGEPWIQKGDAPEWERLWERRERYVRGKVPERGLILTAGVDVQGDRLEVEVVAWGRGRESWSVDYRIIPGDPDAEEIWRELDEILLETFDHPGGSKLPIRRMAIDSGFATSQVYRWARRHNPDRVMVLKGRGTYPVNVGQPLAVEVTAAGKRLRKGVRVWPVGTGLIKSELYGWLRLPMPREGEPSPGYCHFPEYAEEYFQQLTAEQLVTRPTRGGYKRLEWEKTRDRNEALDCRVYARSAAVLLGIDRWSDARWTRLESLLGVASRRPEEQSKAEPPTAPKAPALRAPPRKRRGGGFLEGWRGP